MASERFNAALRLHRILRAAKTVQGNKSVQEGWAEVFELPVDRVLLPIRVAHLLGVMHDEFLRVREIAAQSQFPPAYHQRSLDTIEGGLSPEYLVRPFSHYQSHFPEDAMKVLESIGYVGPETEQELTKEVRTDLLKQVDRLRVDVHRSKLPDRAKAFINRQLDLIVQALREYRIVGIRAFAIGYYAASAEWKIDGGAVADQQDTPQMDGLKKLWLHFTKTADAAVKADKWLTASERLLSVGGKAVDAAGSVIGMLGGPGA